MIHQIKLPTSTLHQLSQVVGVQMALLTYAARRDAIDRASCVAFLEKIPAYRGRGDAIAQWVFDGEKRYTSLEQFANGKEGCNTSLSIQLADLQREKRQLVRQMRRDVGTLCRGNGNVSLEFYMLKAELPSWMKAANSFLQEHGKYPDWLRAVQNFLIGFYEGLYSGLKGTLFVDGEKYDRQDFFAAFNEENSDLYVCAICDETSFRTISGDHYYGDIEHYFPKTIYPHLSCHPYNLIPICTYCNRFIHRDKDPLKTAGGDRRRLGKVFLPYRQHSLGDRTALKLIWELQDSQPTEMVLVERDAGVNLRDKIVAFGEMYDIPRRWEGKLHEIGEHLWRRIRHFMTDDLSVADAMDSTEFVRNKLGRLLAYTWEDLGKDPLAFPSLWWLATLMVTEIDPVLDGGKESSAFLLDIQDWARHDISRRENLESRATELRQVVKVIHASSTS